MTKKDLIIGAFSGYDWSKIKYWVNSINMSGFTGDKIVIIQGDVDQETMVSLNNAGVLFSRVPQMNIPVPIHVARFFWIWKLLSERKHEYNYVITTDVRDVVFQSNPSTWLRKEKTYDATKPRLVVASESIKYKDEPWGRDNFRHCFGDFFYDLYKDHTIYNVGTFAGTQAVVRDLALLIFQMSLNRPIAIVDQAVFNFLIYQQPYRSFTEYNESEDGFAAELGTTMDPTKLGEFKPFLLDKLPIVVNDTVCTSYGRQHMIVHQYDRVPGLREKIEAKYGN